jgi:hypothetical protein
MACALLMILVLGQRAYWLGVGRADLALAGGSDPTLGHPELAAYEYARFHVGQNAIPVDRFERVVALAGPPSGGTLVDGVNTSNAWR